jgi:carboxymethylenebutenolidase
LGTQISLTASDGFKLGGYRADPQGKPKGGLVVIQEIFGVNHHIRNVCDRFAAQGYVALAPAVFDRYKPNFECGYTPAEIEEARKIIPGIDRGAMLRDTAAAVEAVKSAGKVGIVGYCYGGTAAWMAASRLPGLACAVPYYGGGVPNLIGEQPKCPILFHWGETDHSIPLEASKKVAAAHPDAVSHFYKAGHGFNCDQRGSYHADSAKLARSRTLAFLAKHVG